jgi:hypothetical protein
MKTDKDLSAFEERLEYLEDNLAQIQASTRTLFKFMMPVHDRLRMFSKAYYFWHLVKYSSLIHWLILILVIVYLAILISVLATSQFLGVEIDHAQPATKTLTSQADWSSGTYSTESLDLTDSSGSVQLRGEGKLDLKTMYQKDNSIVTVTTDTANKDKPIDGVWETMWLVEPILDESGQPLEGIHSWQIDLKDTYHISMLRIKYSCPDPATVSLFYSLNGTDWINADLSYTCSLDPVVDDFYVSFNTRYLRHEVATTLDSSALYEFEVYFTPLQATHTSAPGQIGATPSDPDRYVVDWKSFSPNETEPANSYITYRFRKTNQDGSWTGDWTDYLEYTGTAIDLSSHPELTISQDDIDNSRTYLQIETKLEMMPQPIRLFLTIPSIIIPIDPRTRPPYHRIKSWQGGP